MSNENIELELWHQRVDELTVSNERLKEERDAARSSVDLLMHDNAQLTAELRMLNALIDRLRIALSQGAEL
jgi:hypothetical protein